jgi:MYXO-CTERM domain-containing protein
VALKVGGSGPDGQCSLAAAGVDPHSDCAADAPSTCQNDGECDGKGGCRRYQLGTPCASANAGCNADSVVNGMSCDGFGGCVADSAPVSCAPYACNTGVCRTSCATDAECSTNAYCNAGICHPQGGQGAVCAAAAECASGFCVDGVCCNTACDALCEVCTALAKGAGNDGECGPVAAGSDPEDECPTDEPSTCKRSGACDGARSCQLYPQGAACGATCNGGRNGTAFVQRCDGNGLCGAAEASPCGRFACAVDACKAGCSTDDDCAVDFRCDTAAGDCIPTTASCDGDTLVDPQGVRTDCSPYRCVAARCSVRCSSSSDCASGFVCNATEQCVPRSAPPIVDDSGCGCRTARSPRSASYAWSLLTLLVLMARRTRRFTANRSAVRAA